MPFNFWFVHTTPGGHIDGISGDCDLNREKSSGSSMFESIQNADKIDKLSSSSNNSICDNVYFS